jgi:hypothetical protein
MAPSRLPPVLALEIPLPWRPGRKSTRTCPSSVVFTTIIVEFSLRYRQEIADMLNRIIKVALEPWRGERPTHSHHSTNALQTREGFMARVAAERGCEEII